jgi:hypothetical protein
MIQLWLVSLMAKGASLMVSCSIEEEAEISADNDTSHKYVEGDKDNFRRRRNLSRNAIGGNFDRKDISDSDIENTRHRPCHGPTKTDSSFHGTNNRELSRHDRYVEYTMKTKRLASNECNGIIALQINHSDGRISKKGITYRIGLT